MLIEQKHHFYAAHRNQQLASDPCWFLHGHTYHVTVCVELDQTDNCGVSILFSDLKQRIETIIKQLDHRCLLHQEDPLYEAIRTSKEPMLEEGLVAFPFETSVENLSAWLFQQINQSVGGLLSEIRLQETTTSICCFQKKDFLKWDYVEYQYTKKGEAV